MTPEKRSRPHFSSAAPALLDESTAMTVDRERQQAPPLDDDEIQYLSLLLGIIDSRNWKALGYAILNDPAVFRSFARKIADSDELNGMTILHACVRANPPADLVKVLLELVPDSPRRLDCLRRTPLHVATGTRASVETIRLLAKSYPKACGLQDEDGKTPLHLACDSTCELFEGDDNDTERGPPRYEVVEALVRASPLSVPLEDQDGMSALEHAIFSDASIKIVKLLQHVTRRQLEVRQKRRESMEVDPPSKDEETRGSFRSVADLPVCESLSLGTVIPAGKGSFRGGEGASFSDDERIVQL